MFICCIFIQLYAILVVHAKNMAQFQGKQQLRKSNSHLLATWEERWNMHAVLCWDIVTELYQKTKTHFDMGFLGALQSTL